MKQPTYEQLREYYDSTYGAWMIDRDPKEVDIDWIRENAFQTRLTDADKVCKDTSYIEEENKFGCTFDNKEKFIDRLNISYREDIRMKCLEAALKFFLAKEGKLTSDNVINLAEKFYNFVKG